MQIALDEADWLTYVVAPYDDLAWIDPDADPVTAEDNKATIDATGNQGVTCFRLASTFVCQSDKNQLAPGDKIIVLMPAHLSDEEEQTHVRSLRRQLGERRDLLVTALRERFDLPVHLHTHDTPGGQLATLIAAIESGVDAVDAACASMAGTTSQPPLSYHYHWDFTIVLNGSTGQRRVEPGLLWTGQADAAVQ